MLWISKHFYLRKFELYIYTHIHKYLQEHIKYYVMTAEHTLQLLTLFYMEYKIPLSELTCIKTSNMYFE